MNGIIIAGVIVGVVGIIVGVLLGVASEAFKVEVDQRVIDVQNSLNNNKITFTDMLRASSNSTDHNTFYDDFNYVYPKIQNSFRSNVNKIQLTNCSLLTMTWREIRKAVI